MDVFLGVMMADPDLNVDAGAILLDLDIGSGFAGKPPGLDQGSEKLSNLTASKLAKDSITVALDDFVTAVVVTAAPAETEVVEDVDNADVAALEDVKGSATDTGGGTGGGKITPDNPVLIFPLGLGIVTGLIIGDVFELVDADGLATCEVLCVKVVPMNPLEASNDEDVDEAE